VDNEGLRTIFNYLLFPISVIKELFTQTKNFLI